MQGTNQRWDASLPFMNLKHCGHFSLAPASNGIELADERTRIPVEAQRNLDFAVFVSDKAADRWGSSSF